MGAGFGHTYEVFNNSYAALAFSHENVDLFESAEEYVQAQNDEIEDQEDYFTAEHAVEKLADFLREDLKAIKTIEVSFKGRLFDVGIDLESTYYGEDMCLVPRDLWEAYCHRIEYDSTNSEAINWQAVAKHEDDLQAAFELAVCEVVFKEYPQMWVRQRIHGWCGTTYKPVSDYILDLKK